MGRTSGPVSLPSCTGRHPSSVNVAGKLRFSMCLDGWLINWLVFVDECRFMMLFSGWLIDLPWLLVFYLSFFKSIFPVFQVRMAGPQYQENGMEPRGRGKTAASGQINAHTVANHRSDSRTHSRAVLGALWIFAVRNVTVLCGHVIILCFRLI